MNTTVLRPKIEAIAIQLSVLEAYYLDSSLMKRIHRLLLDLSKDHSYQIENDRKFENYYEKDRSLKIVDLEKQKSQMNQLIAHFFSEEKKQLTMKNSENQVSIIFAIFAVFSISFGLAFIMNFKLC
jgi:hypothetical protein